MKNLFLLFFFFSTLCVNGQSDSIVTVKRSVIALDKVKTVYRGIANPISIAVSDCKSFTVEGIGVKQVSEGKYIISPGQGNETKIVVTITNFDDSITVEEHNFTVRNIPLLLAKINGQNCNDCIIELTKEQIKNAILSVGFNDFKIDLDFNGELFQVKQFGVNIIGIREITVFGYKFSEKSLKVINKLKIGTEFYILNVRYPNPLNVLRRDPKFIKIKITD